MGKGLRFGLGNQNLLGNCSTVQLKNENVHWEICLIPQWRNDQFSCIELLLLNKMHAPVMLITKTTAGSISLWQGFVNLRFLLLSPIKWKIWAIVTNMSVCPTNVQANRKLVLWPFIRSVSPPAIRIVANPSKFVGAAVKPGLPRKTYVAHANQVNEHCSIKIGIVSWSSLVLGCLAMSSTAIGAWPLSAIVM